MDELNKLGLPVTCIDATCDPVIFVQQRTKFPQVSQLEPIFAPELI
jgi:hypothetical protein